MVRMQILVTKEQKQWIEEQAQQKSKEEGYTSEASIVRRAITEAMKPMYRTKLSKRAPMTLI